MSERAATIAQVIRAALDRRDASLRVSMPGRVEGFDPASQTATVQPLLRTAVISSDGTRTIETLPKIHRVPVAFAGGGGFAETFPVSSGDPCMLVFADQSIDGWQDTGALADPADVRTHALTDAIAILGVRKSGGLAEFDPSRAVFGNNGPRVAVDGTAVHLGVAHLEAGTQSVIRGDAYLTAEQTLMNAIGTAATGAGAALTAASVAVGVAAPLNAVPIVGGILALPGLATAVASLATAGTALTALQGAIAAFLAQRPTMTTPLVKTP